MTLTLTLTVEQFPMAPRSSSLDSGDHTDPAVRYNRRHTVDVRGRVEVRLRVKVTIGVRLG